MAIAIRPDADGFEDFALELRRMFPENLNSLELTIKAIPYWTQLPEYIQVLYCEEAQEQKLQRRHNQKKERPDKAQEMLSQKKRWADRQKGRMRAIAATVDVARQRPEDHIIQCDDELLSSAADGGRGNTVQYFENPVLRAQTFRKRTTAIKRKLLEVEALGGHVDMQIFMPKTGKTMCCYTTTNEVIAMDLSDTHGGACGGVTDVDADASIETEMDD